MTFEEAHSILSNGLVNAPSEHEWCIAFEMAVQALEQHSNEDCISREDTMTALRADLSFICPGDQLNAIRIVEGMLPVASQPKMGKWIMDYKSSDSIVKRYYCSECNRLVMYYDDTDNISLIEKYPYCHCGAKMEGVEE